MPSFIFIALYLFTSVSTALAAPSLGSKDEVTLAPQTTETTKLLVKIMNEINCPKKPCKLNEVEALYKKLLKTNQNPFFLLYSANISQYSAASPKELMVARSQENMAIHKILNIQNDSFYTLSVQAREIASHYKSGLFFPANQKKHRHWLSVAQSFYESALYRCPNRHKAKCFIPHPQEPPKFSPEETEYLNSLRIRENEIEQRLKRLHRESGFID
ncbi:hypothetical protein [Candidatus Terasakiella magnetica]|nr:hypothetical protein [Candidatus Terasakiella magnetica]